MPSRWLIAATTTAAVGSQPPGAPLSSYCPLPGTCCASRCESERTTRAKPDATDSSLRSSAAHATRLQGSLPVCLPYPRRGLGVLYAGSAIVVSAAISAWLTASHPSSEVKQVRAGVVLRWGTTREGPVLRFLFLCASSLISFVSPLFFQPVFPSYSCQPTWPEEMHEDTYTHLQ